ncbi:MAG: class A beta-lactamase-related serine hydrolase [Defluviitaleaceae bacterium]|nr:class A beta-lactamase-related serine hydrolase [Defluviitaleaceae bacterium]
MRQVSSWIYYGLIIFIMLYFGIVYAYSEEVPYEPIAALIEIEIDIPDEYNDAKDYIAITPAWIDATEEPPQVDIHPRVELPPPDIVIDVKELASFLCQPGLVSPAALQIGTYRLMPLFSQIDDEAYVSVIPLTTVEVIETDDRWWRINTYRGPKWINLDAEIIPSVDHITALLRQHGSRIGVYYKNLATGFVYSYNPSRIFFSASLNKATHALYTYIAAERGYIDMYALHTFRAADFWGGTGIMRFIPAGGEFTIRELLYYSIVHSDNIAFRMLSRIMDNIEFSYRDFMIEMGFNPRYIIDQYSQNASAAEMGLWMYAIQAYIESDSRYAHYLYEDMRNVALYSHPYFTRGTVFGGTTDINVELLHSDYPLAQKYGWAASVFNVMGIAYAPSPYILVILSNMAAGAHELFEEISWLFQELNTNYFPKETTYERDNLEEVCRTISEIWR